MRLQTFEEEHYYTTTKDLLFIRRDIVQSHIEQGKFLYINFLLVLHPSLLQYTHTAVTLSISKRQIFARNPFTFVPNDNFFSFLVPKTLNRISRDLFNPVKRGDQKWNESRLPNLTSPQNGFVLLSLWLPGPIAKETVFYKVIMCCRLLHLIILSAEGINTFISGEITPTGLSPTRWVITY